MTSSEPTMNGDAYPDDLCEGQTKIIYIQIKNCFEENSKHNIQSGKIFFFISNPLQAIFGSHIKGKFHKVIISLKFWCHSLGPENFIDEYMGIIHLVRTQNNPKN